MAVYIQRRGNVAVTQTLSLLGVAKQLPASCLLALQLLQIGLPTAGEWKEPVVAIGFHTVRVQHLALVYNSSVTDVDRASVNFRQNSKTRFSKYRDRRNEGVTP